MNGFICFIYLVITYKTSFKRGENMKEHKMLYNVANGIFAAGKIGEVLYLRQNSKRNEKGRVTPITSMCKILDILAQYAPEEERETFGAEIMKSKMYLETCNNLGRHFSTYARSIDANKTVEAINMIKPILGSDERRIAERILRLYDALQ